MAMHATQTDLGGHLDLLSMYLVSGFALAYAPDAVRPPRVRRSSPSSSPWRCVAGMAVQLRGGSVPVLGHVGNAAFGVEILVALGLEVALFRRAARRRARTCGSGSPRWPRWRCAFAIWTTGKRGHPWCHPDTLLQQHGIWHVLCAVSAYLIFRHYAAERAVPAPDAKDPAHQR